jgi:hypothetical protein
MNASLRMLMEKVGTGESFGGSRLDSRWVTVAFTWNGLRSLGVNEPSLATFPEEFRQGMAARAQILGTTGANHPANWVEGMTGPDLHAIIVLFAPAMLASANDVGKSMRLSYRLARACRSSPPWISRQYRDLTMLMSTSATVIGFRSQR